jgi:dsDNA-binding SOS-regulon protein
MLLRRSFFSFPPRLSSVVRRPFSLSPYPSLNRNTVRPGNYPRALFTSVSLMWELPKVQIGSGQGVTQQSSNSSQVTSLLPALPPPPKSELSTSWNACVATWRDIQELDPAQAHNDETINSDVLRININKLGKLIAQLTGKIEQLATQITIFQAKLPIDDARMHAFDHKLLDEWQSKLDLAHNLKDYLQQSTSTPVDNQQFVLAFMHSRPLPDAVELKTYLQRLNGESSAVAEKSTFAP